MNLGILDLLYELLPLHFLCYFRHKYYKINYRGKMKLLCGRCLKFKGGGEFAG